MVPLRLDDQEKEPGSENKVVLDPGRGNPVLGIDEWWNSKGWSWGVSNCCGRYGLIMADVTMFGYPGEGLENCSWDGACGW